MRALRGMGANVDSYLPDRASDGYGLNVGTVRRLAARGTRLLVTVDCAITAVEEVAAARALGHGGGRHRPPRAARRRRAAGRSDRAPAAVRLSLPGAVRDRASPTSSRRRCCAGRRRASRSERELEQDLDLVALATIADVVPLVGENRTLVRRGLRALASTTKPGLRALMAVSRGSTPAR